MITDEGKIMTARRCPILADFVNQKNRMILHHSQYKQIRYVRTTKKISTRNKYMTLYLINIPISKYMFCININGT